MAFNFPVIVTLQENCVKENVNTFTCICFFFPCELNQISGEARGCHLVELGFNATLTAKVISWRSVTHMCFLAFSHKY